MGSNDERRVIDLVGVKCPLNWARAKTALESLDSGTLVELLTDDPRAVTDIPRAAEAEGYCVVAVESDGPRARITIER